MSALLAWFAIASAPTASATQKILKWELKATVIEKIDPNGLFPDVRLGDPVHGWMSYDYGNDADEELSEENHTIYINNFGFEGVSMTIENPRSGNDLQFIHETKFFAGSLTSIGDNYDDPDDGLVDWVWVDAQVEPPPGSLSNFGDIGVFLYGPSTVLPDGSLPLELNLADWPVALISFADRFLIQDPSEIIAEIYELRPVEVAPGDFDSNGVVDNDDLHIWVESLAIDWPGVRQGDANGDGAVDGADFLIWQQHLGSSSAMSELTSLPEPLAGVLLASGFGSAPLLRRRQ